ncbi:MAG: hypothetical protein JRG76_04090 [Deltaproteobacteria bacterium]|nr:hypothetical protein [Deltaproteobacteria bacterium]MBW2413670.1 hypothetical protein [Deltaproteobacteria bacterium]
MSALTNVRTALRERYQRAALLDAAGQMRECVEYLQHPEILVAEFSDSYLTASEYDRRDQEFWAPPEDLPRRRVSDDVCDQLVRASQVRVLDDPEHCFRYVAREIFPLRAELGGHAEGDRRAAGLDYVGLIAADPCVPVLGVVHVPADRTVFLSLMRLLTCLAEVATEAQVDRANRFLFRGVLPPEPTFDLHVLTESPPDLDAQPPISHLTHDLANVFVTLLRDEWQFPNMLRNIYCLRMSLKDFDGGMQVDWKS